MRASLPAKPLQPVILLGWISTDCKIRLWPVQKAFKWRNDPSLKFFENDWIQIARFPQYNSNTLPIIQKDA
jgi:hypothetical protein